MAFYRDGGFRGAGKAVLRSVSQKLVEILRARPLQIFTDVERPFMMQPGRLIAASHCQRIEKLSKADDTVSQAVGHATGSTGLAIGGAQHVAAQVGCGGQ